MGKVSKAVKTADKKENKSKIKKLVNNPGVTKPNAKVNLKDARAPLAKLLKNKSEADKNVIISENGKSLKSKKKLSTPNDNSVKNKAEQVPIMKTLKRKSNAESTVKLPIPKKAGNSPNVQNKKLKTKKPVQEPETVQKQKVQKKQDSDVTSERNSQKAKDTEPQTPNMDVTSIDADQVAQGVSAVLQLAKIQAESKKTLFDGEHQPIFLQVSCIKVPKVPRRQLRMTLPHSLVTDTDDVALFVGDLKKGRAQDFEPTINHYKDLLEQHGCTQIKEVIPLTQVKVEYDQYELKRKLLSSYDYFLTDGKIAGHLSHLLGKPFIVKRKLPASVRMDGKDLKYEINKSLRKTSMQLHSNGNSHIVQVAHTAMENREILNNVIYVCKTLARAYPGGWINIRSLMLKTASSLPVPIYMTLKSKNKVKVPVVLPKRPKAHHDVSGELSTASGNTRVVVRPDGTVTVHKTKGKSDKKNTEAAVKKAKLVTDKLASKKTKQNKKKTKATKGKKENLDTTTENDETPTAPLKLNAEVSEAKTKIKRLEDSEDEIEEAEQAYLSQWQQESTSPTPPPTTQEKPPKKKSKIVKKRKTKA